MIFKSFDLIDEWASPTVTRDLRVLAASAENLLWRIANRPVCVTNVLEDAGVTSTHSEGRAMDLRTMGHGWFDPADIFPAHSMIPYLTIEQATAWCDKLNATWSTGVHFVTGKEMPCAVLHDVGLGHHLHIQVAHGRELRRRVL